MGHPRLVQVADVWASRVPLERSQSPIPFSAIGRDLGTGMGALEVMLGSVTSRVNMEYDVEMDEGEARCRVGGLNGEPIFSKVDLIATDRNACE